MSYVIYVATDGKSEGSYNLLGVPVYLGGLLLMANQRVVTTMLKLVACYNLLLLIVNQRVVTTKVSISQNMSNYNDN